MTDKRDSKPAIPSVEWAPDETTIARTSLSEPGGWEYTEALHLTPELRQHFERATVERVRVDLDRYRDPRKKAAAVVWLAEKAAQEKRARRLKLILTVVGILVAVVGIAVAGCASSSELHFAGQFTGRFYA